MNEKDLTIIEEVVGDVVRRMGFDAKIETRLDERTTDDNEEESGPGVNCNVLLEKDSNFLIGQFGVNLQALQHVVRLLIRKRTDEHVKFVLDVNSYRQQKNQSILEQARAAAEQAQSEKRAVVMKPMSAYERRLVHLELSRESGVVTESVGDGEDRKIIVKPSVSIL